MEEMQFLNPALKTKSLPANGKSHTLRMPVAAKQVLVANKTLILDSARKSGKVEFEQMLASDSEAGKELLYYLVKSGDGLGIRFTS